MGVPLLLLYLLVVRLRHIRMLRLLLYYLYEFQSAELYGSQICEYAPWIAADLHRAHGTGSWRWQPGRCRRALSHCSRVSPAGEAPRVEAAQLMEGERHQAFA